MAYSTIVDLKKFMSVEEIIQTTDDHDTNDIDVKVVDDAIERADTFIDSFLRGRYPTEMESGDVPPMISDISTKLTAYYLYSRRLRLTIPETLEKAYKMCIKTLEGIQAGKITPFPQENEPGVILTNKTAASRTYNSRVWSKYD